MSEPAAVSASSGYGHGPKKFWAKVSLAAPSYSNVASPQSTQHGTGPGQVAVEYKKGIDSKFEIQNAPIPGDHPLGRDKHCVCDACFSYPIPSSLERVQANGAVAEMLEQQLLHVPEGVQCEISNSVVLARTLLNRSLLRCSVLRPNPDETYHKVEFPGESVDSYVDNLMGAVRIAMNKK